MKYVNIIGITFDIIGAIVMFWKTPHPSKVTQHGMGYPQIEKEKKDARVVRLGLYALLFGFGCQLIAAIFTI